MERWKLATCVVIYSTLLLLILNAFQDKAISFPLATLPLLSKDDTQASPTPDPPQICSPDQRIRRVKRWCEIQKNVHFKAFPTLNELDTPGLKKVVKKLLVDDKHKVLYCDIAKSGSTTWKHILANNTGHYSERGTQSIHSMKYIREKYNITQLMLMTREQILERLKNYYTFIVVRHPLDRLISGYRDKLAGNNGYYERVLGQPIIKAMRPNPSPQAVKTGRGVTFQEYISYVSSIHMRDQHFENYQDHCQPCIIDYDYIVKLETQAVDGKYVIEEHLSGYGADNLVNHHSRRGGATLSKHLAEFQNISRELLHEVSEVYGRDMDMFGYSVEERDGKIVAACGEDSVADCC